MTSGSVAVPPTNPADGTEGSDGFTRLHITPLDPDLLKIIVPASILPRAQNISFHTIATFPERRYGYVDLPLMDAEKIKKKLNGTVLKGTKVRIEKARAQEIHQPSGEPEASEQPKKKKKKSSEDAETSKKRKRDAEVLEGVVLNGRKVKRGWTEPQEQRKKRKSKKDEEPKEKEKEKRKRTKSKYTDQEECLLKTRLPRNATAPPPEDDGTKKRRKEGKSREVTVHEFEKTTKFPSFLKNSAPSTDKKPAVEFVEGTGWVDEDGNVVEAVTKKSRPAPGPRKPSPAKAKAVAEEKEEDSDSSSSSSDSSSEDSDSDSDSDEVAEEEDVAMKEKEEEEQVAPKEPEPLPTPTSAARTDTRPISSSSSRSLTIKIPPVTPSAVKVHPLEALYKRAKPDGNGAQTPGQESKGFSFFGGDNDNGEEGPSQMTISMPMTPYSRQEFEWRNVRSAAPTPDTAHPTRVHNFWASQGDSLPEEDEEDEDDGAAAHGITASVEADAEEMGEENEEDDNDAEPPQDQAGSSDFQKWFWENRRDLNRSWMQRRKTAAKEKRHRDNKARASKAV
ncbi:hypothetical protein B0I35DRAFT_429567 [Stachybotrys elegans]|uniref:Uncharacterized protein n=1 Tax=Stachybotrys elegans TaxID=80388 RepID=A0A8K0SN13_9HYPO|nr:hypothetical protein B0I35DRAFT_429567 [Stachybotrys elegans]